VGFEEEFLSGGGEGEFQSGGVFAWFGDEFDSPDKGDEFAGEAVGGRRQVELEGAGFLLAGMVEGEGIDDLDILGSLALGEPEEADFDGFRRGVELPAGDSFEAVTRFEAGEILAEGDFELAHGGVWS